MSLSHAEHIPDDMWVDFVENRIPGATAAKLEAHLNSGCEKCGAEWTTWKRFLGVLDGSRAAVPPAPVLQRAFDLYATFTPQPSAIERILAILAFDSRQNTLPALARASTGSEFNLVYTASDANIQLWCEYDGLRWQLTGQMIPADSFWSVAAVSGKGEVRTDTDETGEFRLSDLAPDRYDLVLRGANREVLIPVISLEEE